MQQRGHWLCLTGALKKRSPEPLTLPSLTSWSRWFHRVLQSSVVCPLSWRYWQWRLWLRLKGSPLILFGHLKYGSFLIFSKTWCIDSRNTVLTPWGDVGLDCPSKIPQGSVIVVAIQPEIPHFLRDNLTFSLALLLVLFNCLILINPIHKLVHIGNRFPSQILP